MKKGTKKSPVTKEQLIREQKIANDRKFVIDQFFPALKESTISADEATLLMGAAVAVIMEEAMQTLHTTRMKEIKNRLIKQLCPNDERLLQIEKLVSMFDDKTLFETRGHLESMKAVIEQVKIDEMRKRPLDSFEIDWNRMLNK